MDVEKLIATGWRWGVTGSAFLDTDSRMSCEDRTNLVAEATILYLTEQNEKRLDSENYEGELYYTGKHERLESISGPCYVAELDTNFGKAKLKFIVDERTIPGYTPWSVNN